jgi:hypothetical protein
LIVTRDASPEAAIGAGPAGLGGGVAAAVTFVGGPEGSAGGTLNCGTGAVAESGAGDWA